MAQMAFLERLFVNSPLAAWLQKREVAHLASLAPPASKTPSSIASS